MKANLSNYSQLENLLGYDLNSGAKTYGPDYLLYFHDGTLTARSPHEIGPSTYGVISGGEGGYYYQCPVPDWGTFTAAAVPLPPSLFLLGPGMLGLLGIRVGRRIKGQPLTI
jgi:hypothetical protein